VDRAVFHVFSKSIADFRIFNSDDDFRRMISVMWFYQIRKPPIKFSWFYELKETNKQKFKDEFASKTVPRIVDIVAYCLMPTHLHLVLAEKEDGGVSFFMSQILNSYTRYFNTKHNRKGPLWESRFKKVEIGDDDQLRHVTRYVHLNPVTAYLTDKPQLWPASSYGEYISSEITESLCSFRSLIDMSGQDYKNFTEDQVSYQRELAKIKNHMLD
jgi:putative transposase